MSDTWGAIFDWDGVIIDSSRQHHASWERLAAEERRTLPPDHFERGFGMRNRQIIPEILGWTHDVAEIERLGARKEEIFRELVLAEGIEPLPGVVAFLEALRTAGVPAAIGTSTPRQNLTFLLRLMRLEAHFRTTVTSEDVTRGKPDPEVFLLAAARLGLPPARCIVFEDAPVGIQAARAGAIRVVAVTNSHPAASLSDADRIVERLDTLEPAELAAWLELVPAVSPGT